jgi:hypothetical protein
MMAEEAERLLARAELRLEQFRIHAAQMKEGGMDGKTYETELLRLEELYAKVLRLHEELSKSVPSRTQH